MTDAVTMKMTLPKIPDIELVALEGLDRLARHLGIAEEKIGEARILVTEAVINALEHSGEKQPSVRVEFTMTTDDLVDIRPRLRQGFRARSVVEPDIQRKLELEEQARLGTEPDEDPCPTISTSSRTGTGPKIIIKKLLR